MAAPFKISSWLLALASCLAFAFAASSLSAIRNPQSAILAAHPFSFWKSDSGTPTPTPTPVSPTDIAGLKLWLKADSLGLSDGAAVDTWTDYSGTSNSATSTGSQRPIFKTAIINGLAVVRFDGSDDLMSFPNDPLGVTTTFTVMQLNAPPSNQTTYAPLVITGSNTPGLRILARTSTTNWGTYTGSDLDSGENLVSGTPALLEMSTTTTGTILYRDGVQKATSGARAMGDALGVNYIGAEPQDKGGGFVNADIAEVVIYEVVLSTENRQAIEDYLGTKYGITITH